MKKFVYLMIIATLFASVAIYADMQAGINALNAKNYTKAFSEFLPEAQDGNADAQNYIGNLYSAGLGVKQDYKQAFHWYEKAAKQKNMAATGNLGNMYLVGLGISKNYSKAVALLSTAASNGISGAMYSLARVYYAGLGVPQNYPKAVELLSNAANKNNAEAQKLLGGAYYLGLFGLQKDYVKAFNLLNQSANNGLREAQIDLGTMYKLGRGTKQNSIEAYKWYYIAVQNGSEMPLKAMKELEKIMTKKQLAQAKQFANEWLKTHKEIDTAFNEIQGTSTNLAAEIKNADPPDKTKKMPTEAIESTVPASALILKMFKVTGIKDAVEKDADYAITLLRHWYSGGSTDFWDKVSEKFKSDLINTYIDTVKSSLTKSEVHGIIKLDKKVDLAKLESVSHEIFLEYKKIMGHYGGNIMDYFRHKTKEIPNIEISLKHDNLTLYEPVLRQLGYYKQKDSFLTNSLNGLDFVYTMLPQSDKNIIKSNANASLMNTMLNIFSKSYDIKEANDLMKNSQNLYFKKYISLINNDIPKIEQDRIASEALSQVGKKTNNTNIRLNASLPDTIDIK